MLEFGASFRKSRESLNVSIDKIAEETRINSRFLLAIENERFDLLPGGIFNRGFIRTYAQRLGIDPDQAIQGYEEILRAVEAEPIHQEVERPRGKTTKIPVYYVAVAGLLILVVVFYMLKRPPEIPAAVQTASVPESSAPEPLAPPEPPTPDATVIAAAETETIAPPVTRTVAPAEIPATPVATVSTVAEAAPTSGSIVVELEVQEESWFKLSADGSDVVPSEVLSAGTTRRYTAANSMAVSIGNAAGVALRVNGQPVTSLGRSGQVRNLTITPSTSASSLNVR